VIFLFGDFFFPGLFHLEGGEAKDAPGSTESFGTIRDWIGAYLDLQELFLNGEILTWKRPRQFSCYKSHSRFSRSNPFDKRSSPLKNRHCSGRFDTLHVTFGPHLSFYKPFLDGNYLIFIVRNVESAQFAVLFYLVLPQFLTKWVHLFRNHSQDCAASFGALIVGFGPPYQNLGIQMDCEFKPFTAVVCNWLLEFLHGHAQA